MGDIALSTGRSVPRSNLRAAALFAGALIALALYAPSPSTPTPKSSIAVAQETMSPSPSALPSAPPDADRDTLAALVAESGVEWESPEFDVVTDEFGTIRTTVTRTGDGTLELARISRYPSVDLARASFGDRRPIYFGMQARRGRESAHSGKIFRDTTFIEFRHGQLIFRVETRYERAACGFAREPDGLTARLAHQAVAHHLIPAWAEPTPSCETKVSVDPLPCMVESGSVEVSGRTSIPDCDVIVDGGERRVEALPVDGGFRIEVPLELGTSHRLYVGHLLCRIECDGGTFDDVDGVPLQVWRIDEAATEGPVYLPWTER